MLVYTQTLNFPFQGKLLLLLFVLLLYLYFFNLTTHLCFISPLIVFTHTSYYPVPPSVNLINSFSSVNPLLVNPLNYIHPTLMYVTLAFISLVYLNSLYTLNCRISSVRTYLNYAAYLPTYYRLLSLISLATLLTGSWWALQITTWDGWWNWDSSEFVIILTILVLLVLIHNRSNSTYVFKFTELSYLAYTYVFIYALFNNYLLTYNQHLFFDSTSKTLLTLSTPLPVIYVTTKLVYLHRVSIHPRRFNFTNSTLPPSLKLCLLVFSAITLRVLSPLNWKYLIIFSLLVYNVNLSKRYFTSLSYTFHLVLYVLGLLLYTSTQVNLTSVFSLYPELHSFYLTLLEVYALGTPHHPLLLTSTPTSGVVIQPLTLVSTLKLLITPNYSLSSLILQLDNYNTVYILLPPLLWGFSCIHVL